MNSSIGLTAPRGWRLDAFRLSSGAWAAIVWRRVDGTHQSFRGVGTTREVAKRRALHALKSTLLPEWRERPPPLKPSWYRGPKK